MQYRLHIVHNGRFWLIVCAFLCLSCMYVRAKDATPRTYYNSDSIHSIYQLQPQEVNNDIVLPKREHFKSSKEALEVVEEVVRRKNDCQYYHQQYCNFDVYDKLMFAWNNYNPSQRFYQRWPFMKQYADTSILSKRSILPLAMYESFATNYYRHSPPSRIQVVHGRTVYGITDQLHAEDACKNLVKILEAVDVRKNDLRLFFNKIVSPLNEKHASRLYRWEIIDTVNIEGKPYMNLCFRPSSLMELGFVGNLYVSIDGNYSIKRVVMKISKSMNVNYVEEFVIYQNFEQIMSDIWVPARLSITAKISVLGILKNYMEFGRSYNNFQFTDKSDSVFRSKLKVVYDKNYKNQDSTFWNSKRSIVSTKNNKEYQSDTIVKQISSIPFINFSIKAADLLTNNYIPLARKGQKNKIGLGTFDTFYSANTIEGVRLRLTLATTSEFNSHLFFSGYAAYGFKDERVKYSLTTVLALNKPRMYPEDFPQNNISLSYEHDLNVLGENYLYLKRDNIFMSLMRYRHLNRMTYADRLKLAYSREFTNGFSYKVQLKSQKEIPAGQLKFNVEDDFGNLSQVNVLQTSEVTSIVRFATNERFLIRNNERTKIPDERFVLSLTHILGLKDVFNGQYHYNRLQLHLIKDFWLASFGQLNTSFRVEKIWGTLPYPLLLAPNANNSYTIESESFSLITPLEFINDRQACWDIDYYFKGWLFRQIPYIKKLHLREIIGVSGCIGSLYSKNNPMVNHSLFIFPENTQLMHNKPYWEMDFGLSNILKIFRVDYVRRLNYLDTPRVKKNGVRVSVQLRF